MIWTPRGRLAMHDDIFVCHNCKWGGGATGIWGVAAEDAAERRRAKNYSVQNGGMAKVEEP